MLREIVVNLSSVLCVLRCLLGVKRRPLALLDGDGVPPVAFLGAVLGLAIANPATVVSVSTDGGVGLSVGDRVGWLLLVDNLALSCEFLEPEVGPRGDRRFPQSPNENTFLGLRNDRS